MIVTDIILNPEEYYFGFSIRFFFYCKCLLNVGIFTAVFLVSGLLLQASHQVGLVNSNQAGLYAFGCIFVYVRPQWPQTQELPPLITPLQFSGVLLFLNTHLSF